MGYKAGKEEPEDPKRRSLLVKGICGLSSIIAGTLAAPIGVYLWGAPKEQHDEWADAGELTDLSPGTPHEITFERTRTDGWKPRTERATAWVVLNNQNGAAQDGVTAFSPLCPHLGCAYRWEAQKEVFVCPCHGSEFEDSGKVLKGPAGRPLDRYLVKVDANRLWLGPIRTNGKS